MRCMETRREGESQEEPLYRAIFIGRARVGEMISIFKDLRLRPEDFASPVSFQMALSRIYESLLRGLSSEPRKTYVAEVSFQDSMGNNIVFATDLGESLPPLSSQYLRVKIVVEFYEE